MSDQGAAMAHIPYGDGLSTPLVRTDFANDERWQALLNLAQAEYEDGFHAGLYIIEDSIFNGCDPAEICEAARNKNHGIVFVVDKFTMQHPDLPILCVFLRDRSKTFRVTPSELWIPQNNLVIGNMGFEEFVGMTDQSGIYRAL
jgi:hypothetical protein